MIPYLILAGAIIFFLLWYLLKHSAQELQLETNLPKGEIVYKGADIRDAEILSAPKHYLRGIPTNRRDASITPLSLNYGNTVGGLVVV